MAARPARPRTLGLAELGEQVGVPPDFGESTRSPDVAREELVMNGERAGVDVSDRVHQADHPSGPAEIEAGERFPVTGEVEEGVTGEHVLAMRPQPQIQLTLLFGRGVEFVPHVGTSARWAKPGQSQLGPVAVG